MKGAWFNLNRTTGAGFSGSVGGEVEMGDIVVDAMAAFPGEDSIFKGSIDSVGLRELATALPGGLALPEDFPDLTLQEVELSFSPRTGAVTVGGRSNANWELPLGIDGISIGDPIIDLRRELGVDKKMKLAGKVQGKVKLGTASFVIAYEIPGDFMLRGKIPSFQLSPLLQELCGSELLRDLPIPASVLAVELSNIEVILAPKRKEMMLAAETAMGKAEIVIKQVNGKWGFTVGFIPPTSWAFSKLDSSLAVMDGLKFSNSAIIVSSSEDRAFALTTMNVPRQDVSIKKGVNFFATMNMAGLGVDQLLEVKTLTVYAAIGTNPRDIALEAIIDGQFPFAENVSFGDIKFRLAPTPTDLSIFLMGTVRVKLDASDLKFVGSLGIRVIAAPPSFQALLATTMEGTWNEPMGARGTAIMNVALELGIAFPPIRPSIGIAGGLKIGDFIGAVAVKFDTAAPGKSMVAVAFNRLHLHDVYKTFCPAEMIKLIPEAISKTVLDIEFRDVNIYIAPQDTWIGTLKFERGIALRGTMLFWGIKAMADIKIDQTSGMLIHGEVDPIDLGGVFQLNGGSARPGALVYMDLRKGQKPGVTISGAIKILGIQREVQVDIFDKGFYLLTAGRLFDLFEVSLEVRGGDFMNGDGISVKVAMKNDLFVELRTAAEAAIRAAVREATSEIEDAQRTVEDARREVNKLNDAIDSTRFIVQQERDRDASRLRDAQQTVVIAQEKVRTLDGEIAAMRATIQGERDRDAGRLRDAQGAVQSAQNTVASLDRQIAAMRQTVGWERQRDSQGLRNAQASVQTAQKTVNDLQWQIDDTKNYISRLNQDIANKQRWYDNLKWFNKTWGWAELSGYGAAKGIEIGAMYTKIGGIEAAKHTARGVLELARQTLRGMEMAAVNIPVDADPRVWGLIGSRDTANGVLEGAKRTLWGMEIAATNIMIDADIRIAGLFAGRETAVGILDGARLALRGMELAAISIPIDLDPRIVALMGTRETANAALSVAIFTLEGVKAGISISAEITEAVVKIGLGGLIDIRAASFEGSLNAVSGGKVKLSLDLSFLEQVTPMTLTFDFFDIAGGVKQMVHELVGG